MTTAINHFEAILNATPESVFLVDPLGCVLAINETAAQRLNCSRADMAGKNVFDFFPPDVALQRKRDFDEVVRSGVSLACEDRRADLYFSLKYHPVLNQAGEVEAVAVFAADITARKLAEESLRNSEIRYRRFAEELPIGIVITQDGLIQYVNQAVVGMIGYSKEELLGRPFLPLVCEADRARVMELHRRRMQSQDVAPSYLVGMVRADGVVRQWSMHASTVEWDGTVCALGSCIDVTERQQRDQELLQTQERLSRAQRASGAGVWDWRLDEPTMYWSPEMCELFGVDPSVTTVALDSWRQAVHPDDLAQASACTARAIREHTPLDSEYRIVLPNGRERWVVAYGDTTYDTQGKPLRITGISVDIGERKRLQQALWDSEERYRTAFLTSPDAININRLSDGRYLEVSAGFCRMTGWGRDEVVGRTSLELNIWADVRDRQRLMEALQRDGSYENLETRFVAKDGSILDGLMSAHLMTIKGEQCLLSVTRDITARKRDEQALREAKELTDAIIENVPLMIFLKRAADLQFVAFNRAGEELVGLDRRDIIGKSDRELFPSEQAERFTEKDREVLGRNSTHVEIVEEPILTANNGVRLLHTRKVCLRDGEGRPKYLLGISEDITVQKAAEDEIKNLAFFDPLTQLPNRRLLMDRLKKVLASSARSGKQNALLFIDLDNFKTLNDSLGHNIGDLLLQKVTQRLLACIREGDTVARLGGDEFVVMLEDLASHAPEAATQAEAVAKQILSALNEGYRLEGYDHRSTASIGITLFSGNQESMEELLKRADMAMYQSKAAGRNTLRFFDPEMQAIVTNRAALEADLHEAVLRDQLVLYYQVQVDAQGSVIGAEALLRWRHPQRGMVQPLDFIALAEDTGLILPIGNWVLNTACVQLRAWSQRPQTAPFTMAVNVSARQIHAPDFVEQVLGALRRTQADPRRLKLELTESLLVRDVDEVIAKMAALKAHGVGFSLDDFGTGYSSLQHLKRLPLDQLKIDRGFVESILTDPNDAAIAKMVIALADSMGLNVIAEGVETAAQREFLAQLGCHAYQGYLFGRPLPREAFIDWGAPV